MLFFRKYLLVLFLLAGTMSGYALQRTVESQIADSLSRIVNRYTFVGKLKVQPLSVDAQQNTVTVTVSPFMAYMPFRPDNVQRIYQCLKNTLIDKYPQYRIVCLTDGKAIEDLIPNYYRLTAIDSMRIFPHTKLAAPLVTNMSCPYEITQGLSDRHIALWQSHGKYFDQKRTRWTWQRSRIFQVVEDLYTQSYVLPFLVPMLENAGANVLLPRERDTQLNEVIVDNDTHSASGKGSRYREKNSSMSWKELAGGFAHLRPVYLQGENPFKLGTAREVETVGERSELSFAEWIPSIPQTATYAVYVSYKSGANSAPDAHYTVYHCGQKTEFVVNQQMGGGTWIFLGYFRFEKGRNTDNRVVLTNFSRFRDKVVVADAVKIGGGMGNVARSPYQEPQAIKPLSGDSVKLDSITPLPKYTFTPEISHYPRYTEGARYWLQWAGVPDSVYSRTHGVNDYSDDFQSRGFWVNYLAGGSVVHPRADGLHIPIDMALAFHSDAGFSRRDSIIGTLGISTIANTQGKYFFENGVSRWASRDLTDIVMTQIVQDIRACIAPEWTRRGMWNKSYSEARVPEVPTMLLELLSHQNFSDMRYGLDPRFRFLVSRAIYKGILRYLTANDHRMYVVQPLPVSQFSSRFSSQNNKVELHWEQTPDTLEPTATARAYRLYTRVDDGDFDNGVLLRSNTALVTLVPGKIYSFKVAAVNEGGQSFPSEIISAYKSPVEKGKAMIINAFDRISAPVGFEMDSTYAGFYTDRDPGVPYLSDISFVGKQYEFKRDEPFVDDDAPGFGASHADFETHEVAGNSFDYPYIHGKAFKASGFSFVSASVKALVTGDVDPLSVNVLDVIFGEQKQTFIGNAKKAPQFKTFTLDLQKTLAHYCKSGGNLLISGAHIASDMSDRSKLSQPNDKTFIENVLHYKFSASPASVHGNVATVESPFYQFRRTDFSYFDQPNIERYYVASPDAIEPADVSTASICRYTENNKSAGIAYKGKYNVCAFGFPLESIKAQEQLDALVADIVHFFEK